MHDRPPLGRKRMPWPLTAVVVLVFPIGTLASLAFQPGRGAGFARVAMATSLVGMEAWASAALDPSRSMGAASAYAMIQGTLACLALQAAQGPLLRHAIVGSWTHGIGSRRWSRPLAVLGAALLAWLSVQPLDTAIGQHLAAADFEAMRKSATVAGNNDEGALVVAEQLGRVAAGLGHSESARSSVGRLALFATANECQAGNRTACDAERDLLEKTVPGTMDGRASITGWLIGWRPLSPPMEP